MLEDGENPFLALGGLSQVVDILVRAFSTDVHETIEAAHGGEFLVEADASSNGPIMVVTAEAPSAKAAAGTLDAALRELPVILTDLQVSVDVPLDQLVTSKVLSQETKTIEIITPTLRAGIVVAGGTALLSALAIGVLDAMFLRRRRAAEPGNPGGHVLTPAQPDPAERDPGESQRPVEDDPSAQGDNEPAHQRRR
jgi:hypothetical protein